jgi:hypothetical protein
MTPAEEQHGQYRPARSAAPSDKIHPMINTVLLSILSFFSLYHFLLFDDDLLHITPSGSVKIGNGIFGGGTLQSFRNVNNKTYHRQQISIGIFWGLWLTAI